MVENAIKRPRFVVDPLMRYMDKVTAARILMLYLPQLTRCGKMFLVSL
jgi:hypothetical protein